jgi:hypothetical protein
VNISRRPLAGLVVNVSISESDDSTRLGFPPWQVNRVTLQNVAALFGQGATVVFGHDWRDDGVMQAVFGFARQVQPPAPAAIEQERATDQPLLVNLLPWPDEPHLPAEDLEQLSSTLCVTTLGLPDGLRRFDKEARRAERDSPPYRYARARALTFLRHRLTAICHARLCLGGRRRGAAGRYPGVIEEALLALRADKPLYLAGILGGATQQIIDAIEGRPMASDFCRAAAVQEFYSAPPFEETDQATLEDRTIDREGVWDEFATAGLDRISEVARLKVDEAKELLHTRVIDRVIELVLSGLSRLQAAKQE